VSTDDKRLIEDYLPIEKISVEASREKSVRKGHISTLHLWWARRPLVACRAAVYGALVPVSRFVPNGASDEKKKSLGRANAAKFVERLCQYPGNPSVIAEAQQHIIEAHAERLTQEMGKKVTVEDIVEGRAPRPKVLDMFAGGGAIPLEALRLGCEAYAVELNPVAHLIELCTLVYPQKYGKPNPTARGITGPKNAKGETSWGGLAEEIRYWGNWVLKEVKADIGDLYPLIPDPEFKGKKPAVQENWLKGDATNPSPAGYLMPVAYLWTRTVICKNPHCRSTVPLAKQTWLCKKKGRFVALKIIAPKGKKQVRFEVVEARTEGALGFDPAAGSSGGNATCPFCGTVADDQYVQQAGCARKTGTQLMAVAGIRPNVKGKVYLAGEQIDHLAPDIEETEVRTKELLKRSQMAPLTEALNPVRPSPNARGLSAVTRHGFATFGDLFTPRQMLCLLQFASAIRDAEGQMRTDGYDSEQGKAVTTFLAAILDRLADFNSSLCMFNYTGGRGVVHTFGRHALPMVWDFAETNPFNPEGASWISGIEDLPAGLRDADMDKPADVRRGSATSLPWPDESLDAVITDPPYYDNVP
jgi:putative DNA methylase